MTILIPSKIIKDEINKRNVLVLDIFVFINKLKIIFYQNIFKIFKTHTHTYIYITYM